MPDYYKTLEVSPNSSPEDIKKSFRKLAHLYHPDKNNGDENKFKEINKAYQILSDKEKRELYDKLRNDYIANTHRKHSPPHHNTQNIPKEENWKTILGILMFAAFLFYLYLFNDQATDTNYNSQPISILPGEPAQSSKPINSKNPKDYTSLPNGTILSKNYYLNGSGELQIKNGTSLDAIAKLVNTNTDKSVFTVYIKANNTYTINKITDGTYKLFFNLGNDWNNEIKAFAVNSSYEVFEDIFLFSTREYREGNYINTEYSTFNVTLNPTIGGDAKTENVDVMEFASY